MGPGVGLVVFDLAGTTVDHGCLAPLRAFIGTFAAVGVTVTVEQASGPMGTRKRDHLAEIAALPEVAEQYREKHGRVFTGAELDLIYRDSFVPRQLEAIVERAALIEGFAASAEELRRRGMRLASTTGYFHEAAARVAEAMTDQGVEFDHAVCADDVPEGRPAPWMIYRCMEALGVYPAAFVVKVGDTGPDMQAARNAGCWAVGATCTGSGVGLTVEQVAALPDDERATRCEAAAAHLRDAGAHEVIESVSELPALLDRIEPRLAAGERP